ncbi:MAG TPA: acyltransferase [Pyrinomonadaceae bacterium]|nr:acyltransferase [Pyrinomonadaceae bacterium]
MLLNRIYRKIFEVAERSASSLRIIHLKLKYSGIQVNFGCRIARGCHISCHDGSTLILENVNVCQNAVIIAGDGGRMEIRNTYIGFGSVLVAVHSIEIRDNCALGEMVVIRDQDHRFGEGLQLQTSGAEYSPVKLGQNVWVGSKATILRGVTVGDNAVIGASAVVTKEVPAGVVAIGIPARAVKQIGEAG